MAELVTDDSWLHNRVLAEMMDFLRKRQFETTPAELMAELVGRTTKVLGVQDPYAERKKIWQEELVGAEKQLRARIESSLKSFRVAARMACIGNLFDDDLLRDIEISELFDRAEEVELKTEVWDDFRRDLKSAETVMFIHDSAGEILLDKLFMERFKEKKIISVVRRNPILSGATQRDAEFVGLGEVSNRIIDPGIDCLGIPLSQCPAEFKEVFESADLVIGKGQAVYETLCEEKRPIYVFLRVKCRVIAEALGYDLGSFVLERT